MPGAPARKTYSEGLHATHPGPVASASKLLTTKAETKNGHSSAKVGSSRGAKSRQTGLKSDCFSPLQRLNCKKAAGGNANFNPICFNDAKTIPRANAC